MSVEPLLRRDCYEEGDLIATVEKWKTWFCEHVSRDAQTSTYEQREKAKERFERIVQKKGSTILEYKEYFDQVKATAIALAGVVITERDSAMKILKGLRRELYQEKVNKRLAEEGEEGARTFQT